MAYDLQKLVKLSALQQLAEKIKSLYYDKEEIDEKLSNISVEEAESANQLSWTSPTSYDNYILQINSIESSGEYTNTAVPVPASSIVSNLDIIPITKGGTGNSVGYIRTGQQTGSNIGNRATAEGEGTIASGNHSHAEGYSCYSQGDGSHAEGKDTKAYGEASHSEGYKTYSGGAYSHTEGNMAVVKNNASYGHAEGRSVAAGKFAHAEGAGYEEITVTLGAYLNSKKYSYTAHNDVHPKVGMYYFDEINDFESYSTWQITNVDTQNLIITFNKADNSLENTEITLYGYNKAIGNYSHAEGFATIADSSYSHAEGSETKASGQASHAEGNATLASGKFSHAGGQGTIAQRVAQQVFGTYNVADKQGVTASKGRYIEIVGNGSDENNRSNARTLDWSGNEVLAGKLTIGANPTEDMDVAPKSYVDALKPLIITFENNTASKTAAEIYAEIPNRQIMCLYNNIYYPITYCSSTLAEFGYYASASDYAKVSIDINGGTTFSAS